MRGGARCRAGRRARWRAAPQRRPRCFGSACPLCRLLGAVRRRCAIPGSEIGLALPASRPRGFRPNRRFRGHRWLCAEGLWRIAHPKVAQQYRMNVGVIIEDPMLDIRLQAKGRPTGAGGRVLGRMEEYFLEQLAPGDTFVFAGNVLRFEGIRENAAYVTRTQDPEAEVPSYQGGKFPLSTFLAMRVRQMLSHPETWKRLPTPVGEWLEIQQWRSVIPEPGQLLVETFPRGSKEYLVCYPFEGRLAHQTLGMLLTRRLERLRMRPLGFVANEYALAIWGLRDMSGLDMDRLFDEDMLGDDLDAWLAESALYKRTFRNCAIIAQ